MKRFQAYQQGAGILVRTIDDDGNVASLVFVKMEHGDSTDELSYKELEGIGKAITALGVHGSWGEYRQMKGGN